MTEDRCWSCGKAVNAHSGVGEADGQDPDEGDFGICLYCGEWGVYESTGIKRKPTNEEFEIIAFNPTCRRVRNMWVETFGKGKET